MSNKFTKILAMLLMFCIILNVNLVFANTIDEPLDLKGYTNETSENHTKESITSELYDLGLIVLVLDLYRV